MARERRQFSDEFKREAVRLAYESGRRLSDVARELDVGTNLIRRWRRKFAGVEQGRAPTTEQQEILRLQRQLSRVDLPRFGGHQVKPLGTPHRSISGSALNSHGNTGGESAGRSDPKPQGRR